MAKTQQDFTVVSNGLVRYEISHSMETILKLYLDEETSDFQFLFVIENGEEKRIHVHKIILAKGSDVFYSMFFGKLKEEEPVKIIDASPEAFSEFLRFFYANTITISMENVAELMYLADKYHVSECLSVCSKFLQQSLTIENICFGYDLAIRYRQNDLKANLEQKISAKTKDVLVSNEFRTCSRDALKHILQIKNLMCQAEELFDACMTWALSACEESESDPMVLANRKKELGECFYMIPFYKMNAKQISNVITTHKELFDYDELIELVNIMAPSDSFTLKKFTSEMICLSSLNVNMGNCDWLSCEMMKPFFAYSKDPQQYVKKLEVSTLQPKQRCYLAAVQFSTIISSKEKLSGTLKFFQKSIGIRFNLQFDEILQQKIEIKCSRSAFPWTKQQIISLDKAILCDSMKPYEIRVEFDGSWTTNSFQFSNTTGNQVEIISGFGVFRAD